LLGNRDGANRGAGDEGVEGRQEQRPSRSQKEAREQEAAATRRIRSRQQMKKNEK
jgi:hypothetical protein